MAKNSRWRAAIVIPAAGLGRRFGSDGARKPFVRLKNRPILIWTLKAFEAVPEVSEIVIAVHPDDVEAAWGVVRRYRCGKIRAIVPGGKTRADSVYCGLNCVSEKVDVVAVHDAARPLVEPGLIQRVLKMAYQKGAALAAVPMVPTTKFVGPKGQVVKTLDRRRLWAAQTPQAFRKSILENAYRRIRGARRQKMTDEAMLVEQAGVRSWVVEDSPRNLKITTPEDLRLAEALLYS